MKSAAVVFGLCSMVLLALAAHRSVAGEASATVDGYWECRNVPIQAVAYFSAIFEANADRAEVQRSYTQMLAAKYGYQGQANCGVAYRGPTTIAKLKDDQARYVKQLQQAQVKVLLTGWVFAGASAAAPAPAAPAAASTAAKSPSKLWVCRGNTNAPSRDMYITNPFAAGLGLATARQTQAALASFMKARYKPTVMMCDTYDTQAEAKARVESLVNFAHTNHFDYVPVNFTSP